MPQDAATPFAGPASTSLTPAQIRHAYGFDLIGFNNGTVAGDGSGTTIAIVDAYDDPNIASNLKTFDAQFGLPDPTFTKVNQTGGTTYPPANSGWALEIALDVEWAHAIAPKANILLVEANDASFGNLLTAVRYAAKQTGVVAVSMSWGSGEFSAETGYDSSLTTPSGHAGVTFVSSSGDSGAPDSYPSASPNVLSVGGTTLTLDTAGNIKTETGWSGSGGGISTYESQPSYQNGVVNSFSTTKRTNPDVAYDASPSNGSGFAVYDTYGYSGWVQVGGTSAGAPQWAALIAIADQGLALNGSSSLNGATQTLPDLYALSSSDFHDITSGTSTGNPHFSAGPGYDLVTGLGTPVANQIVADLSGLTVVPNGLLQGGFEQPVVGTGGGAYQYNPTGSAWTFDNGSGVSGNGSGFTSGNPNAPEGVQVAFLQATGTFSQSVNLGAGTYYLSFSAAQRGNDNSSQTFQVLVDGNSVGTFTPAGTSYSTFTTGNFTVTAGAHTIQFVGLDPNGGDNTAFIDNVQLKATTPSSALQQGGFETPNVGTGANAYQYDPTGSAWAFSGDAGVSGNGSGFTSGNPNAPEGTQVAFLQDTGSFSQSVTLTAGTYNLSFYAAQRGNYGGSQTFQVLVDGNSVGTFTPSGTSYATFTTGNFTVTAGTHTIQFVGLNPNGGDNTAFIDNVQLVTVSSPGAVVLHATGFNPVGNTGSTGVAGTPSPVQQQTGVLSQQSVMTLGVFPVDFGASQGTNTPAKAQAPTYQSPVEGLAAAPISAPAVDRVFASSGKADQSFLSAGADASSLSDVDDGTDPSGSSD